MKNILLLLTLLIITSCKNNNNNYTDNKINNSIKVNVMVVQYNNIEKVISTTGSVNFKNVINVCPKYTATIKNILVNEGDDIKENQIIANIDETNLNAYYINFNIAKRNYLASKYQTEKYNLSPVGLKAFEKTYNKELTLLEFAKKNLAIKSPANALVLRTNFKPNELYNSDTPVITIVKEKELLVDSYISKTIIDKLKLGQEAILKTGINNDRFEGQILYISTQVDSINNMYPITIGLKNSIILNKLRNNQFLIVDIILETKDNVISIPKQALLDDNTVMISENNIVKIKPVKTGISDKNNIEIIDGLNIGERIIINNFDKLVQDQVIIEDSLKNISK
ncbi:MAG: efflux RND transporter periplasmic adaptor subunit [Candidatus Cloacimonetes bacterium]|nr:efflux RND transporter periplasmic adaptor subunit [Candidatus Cloacimonadota bacterium]